MKIPDIGHYIKQMVESALKKSKPLFIPNSLKMQKKMQTRFYLIVLLVMISLKSNNTLHASAQFSPTNTPSKTHDQHQKPDNQTIYKVSKTLCWGCIGESFQFLFAHNWIRAQKWEIPLMWDYNLERYAKWWAEQRRPDCKLQHSFPEGDFKLGENIYWGSGTRWTPGDAVNAWAGEEKFYDYGSNSCVSGEMCGHYTQIVWKNTRRIGCARVVCDDGDLFMTCNYDPSGNYIGERPY